MKAVSKRIVLISLGLFAAVAASATPVEQTYLDRCRKDQSVPVPITVVSPSISGDYTGARADIEFVVDQSGRPSKLHVTYATDETFATAVLDAVKRWTFKPAEHAGSPVTTKVVLPVRVGYFVYGSTFAAN